jgi:hypothetical protein
MTNQAIPAEAVEAAAREINKQHGYAMPPWDELVKSKDRANRNRVKLDREYARVALEAASSLIRAEGFDAYESAPFEIRLTEDGKNWEPFKINPYRSAK